jgi:hypothetical protein
MEKYDKGSVYKVDFAEGWVGVNLSARGYGVDGIWLKAKEAQPASTNTDAAPNEAPQTQ